MPSTQAKASRRSAKLVALEIHLKAHAAFSAMQGTVWIARSRWSRCRWERHRWQVLRFGISMRSGLVRFHPGPSGNVLVQLAPLLVRHRPYQDHEWTSIMDSSSGQSNSVTPCIGRAHLHIVADVLLQQQAVHLAVRVLRRDLVAIESSRLRHLHVCGTQATKMRIGCNSLRDARALMWC